jgi:hypothetical protein
MAHLLEFSRNRCTSVEKIAEDTLRSTCRLQDNLMDAWVQIEVRLPELEIVKLQCRLERAQPPAPEDAAERLQRVVGVRVGPGMLKIIKGLIGGGEAYGELSFMVEECCHGIILGLTKQELTKAPLEPADSREHFAAMVRKNTRLYNRCAAFAPGSPLVEGIEPPN